MEWTGKLEKEEEDEGEYIVGGYAADVSKLKVADFSFSSLALSFYFSLERAFSSI